MNIQRIKHYIKLYMPYKWVLEYEEKRDFIAQYFAWKETNPHVEFDSKSKFNSIISIEGFGYSGSGAVIDLLREYDECKVQGRIEPESGAISSEQNFGEITLLQYPGGLIDIDTIIDTPAKNLGDIAIKRFAKAAYRDAIFNIGSPYKDFFFNFFDALIDDVMRETQGSVAAMFPRIKDNIFTLRGFQKEEYYALCQHFLYSIFNTLYDGNHKFMVVDQMFTTTTMGGAYCRNFLPNLKSIVVWRDPRDIYTIAKRLDLQWLEHDTPEHFIRRIKRKYKNLDINSKDYLAIRFEDLILEYDKTVGKIEKYLNLGEHKRPQSCLDISISCKNVGMWKIATDIPQEDYEKIQKAMPQFCYEK